MTSFYLAFFIGLLPGFVIRHRWKDPTAYWAIVLCGNALVALFSEQMIAAPEIRHALPGNILAAAVIALFAASGSVLLSLLFLHAAGRAAAGPTPAGAPVTPAAGASRLRAWRPTGITLAILAAGMAVGALAPPVDLQRPMRVLLLAMIVAVGVQSGGLLRVSLARQQPAVTGAGRARLLFFILPVFVMAGSLAFGAGAGVVLGERWADGMLCAAPMGWQTLGGPMITSLRGPRLGNIAFLANMIRDIVSLLLIPLISRGRFPLLAVTPGGVSSMDILLPAIQASAGPPAVIHAVWVGACCSFWAPILIGLVARGCP